MYRILVFVILVMFLMLAQAAEPYCNVTTYEYKDGVPSSTGSKIVQDHNGCIWVATWNGLYRFDGYEFCQIRPETDNDVRKYSSRFRDIKIGPDGKMWCRIDDNIVLFDVDTYKFDDLHSRIESILGDKIKIENAIRETTAGDVILNTTDGRYLKFDAKRLSKSTDPIHALRVVSESENISLKSAGFFKTPLPPSFERKDVAFSRKDEMGNIWCITKDGRIMTGSHPEDTFKTISTVEVGGSPIKYSCEDDQGNVWMVSNAGIHRISSGTSPLTYITPPEPSQLRASMTDPQRRVWMSWSDSEYICISKTPEQTEHYLSPNGTLTDRAVRFGSPIYTMTNGPAGQIWLGSKPDGLFRLTPRKDGVGYHIERIKRESSDKEGPQYDNYYDLAFDKRGRLWLATLGNGIEVIKDPTAPNPIILSLYDRETYPKEADKTRRVRIIGDSLIIATTTEGLISFPMPDDPEKDPIAFTLHRSTPGDEHSLGNIATMDAIAGSGGQLYIATESDGLNIMTSPLTADNSKRWEFTGNDTDFPALAETTLTLNELSDGRLLVVGKKDINLTDQTGTGDIEVLGTSLWKKDVVFKEVSPLLIPDGRWLIGLSDGAVAIDIDRDIAHDKSFPVFFTSYNIEGGPSLPMSPMQDTIKLSKDERSMTLTFAALCYSEAQTVRYAYRIDDGEWKPIGSLRTLTFTHLDPGIHTISVRSTDLTGRWLDNSRSVTIDVRPTFWETGWAKLLYAVMVLSIVTAITLTIIYMRRIKRKQREILEAYLNLLEARTSAAYETKDEIKTGHDDEESQPMPKPSRDTEPEIVVKLSSEDKKLISKVVDFIDRNFSDSGITVDDMANAVGVSKSNLTKKMKSLMGVTPADFLKTTRLSKAKIMLKETDCPIKEIAIDCGFSDMNYFGKCFKAAYGITPGNYRKEA